MIPVRGGSTNTSVLPLQELEIARTDGWTDTDQAKVVLLRIPDRLWHSAIVWGKLRAEFRCRFDLFSRSTEGNTNDTAFTVTMPMKQVEAVATAIVPVLP